MPLLSQRDKSERGQGPSVSLKAGVNLHGDLLYEDELCPRHDQTTIDVATAGLGGQAGQQHRATTSIPLDDSCLVSETCRIRTVGSMPLVQDAEVSSQSPPWAACGARDGHPDAPHTTESGGTDGEADADQLARVADAVHGAQNESASSPQLRSAWPEGAVNPSRNAEVNPATCHADSESDGSDTHFDLSSLASPRSARSHGCVETKEESAIPAVRTSIQPGCAGEPHSSQVVTDQPLVGWDAEGEGHQPPMPPPRRRSRSSTPPSTEDDEFDMRRRKQKAKRKLLDDKAKTEQEMAEHRTMKSSTRSNRSSAAKAALRAQVADRKKTSERTRTTVLGEIVSEGVKDRVEAVSEHGDEANQNARPLAEAGVLECSMKGGLKSSSSSTLSNCTVMHNSGEAVIPIESETAHFAEPDEEESIAQEELAQEACRMKDVDALCSALSLMKRSVEPIAFQQEVFGAYLALAGTAASHSSGLQDAQLSPLHQAAGIGSCEMISLLLENGKFSVDSQTTNGNTALHICVWESHLACAEYLLGRGACTDIKNNHGQRAFDFLTPATFDAFDVSDLPLLLNSAANAALRNAQSVLGLCAHDSPSAKRQRFRELASLAKSCETLDMGPGEQQNASEVKDSQFSSICAAYDILLHRDDARYLAGRVALRKSREWAEVFHVLESKGLADIIEWFLQNHLDGPSFLQLTLDDMCARGLDPTRAEAIWNSLHDVPVNETLEQWLREHGEQDLLPHLESKNITSLHELMQADLKSCIPKVGPRCRLRKHLQQRKNSSNKIVEDQFIEIQEQFARELASKDPMYVPCDAEEFPRVNEVDDLRKALIDMTDEMAQAVTREKHIHTEMRVRLQKRKLQMRALSLRVEQAEDRARCWEKQHEAVLCALEQQALDHARIIADKDAELVSTHEELNHLRIQGLSCRRGDASRMSSLYSTPFQSRDQTPADTPRDQDLPALLDSEDASVLSSSLPVDVQKHAYRTARIINKELQLQAVDLQIKVAKLKRDKTLDDSALMVLQQRVDSATAEVSRLKREREQEASENKFLMQQLDSLLNSVTRLVGNEEKIDAMCHEVYQVRMINSELKKALIQSNQLNDQEVKPIPSEDTVGDKERQRDVSVQLIRKEIGERTDVAVLRKEIETVGNLLTTSKREIAELRDILKVKERLLADQEAVRAKAIDDARAEAKQDIVAMEQVLKSTQHELLQVTKLRDDADREMKQEREKAAAALEEAAVSFRNLQQDVRSLRAELQAQREREEVLKARAQELEAQQAFEQVRAQDMAEERKSFELERDEWLKERIRDREEWDRERSEWNSKREELEVFVGKLEEQYSELQSGLGQSKGVALQVSCLQASRRSGWQDASAKEHTGCRSLPVSSPHLDPAAANQTGGEESTCKSLADCAFRTMALSESDAAAAEAEADAVLANCGPPSRAPRKATVLPTRAWNPAAARISPLSRTVSPLLEEENNAMSSSPVSSASCDSASSHRPRTPPRSRPSPKYAR